MFRGLLELYLYQRRRPLLPPLLPNLHEGPNILSSAGRIVGKDALIIPSRGTIAAMSANGAKVYVMSVGSSSSMYLIRTQVIAIILVVVSHVSMYFVRAQENPYMKPSPNIAVSKIFFEVFSCNVHRIGIGSTITMISMIRSAEAMAVYICCASVVRSEARFTSNASWTLQDNERQEVQKNKGFTDHVGVTACTVYVDFPLSDHNQPPYIKNEALSGHHSQLSSVDHTGMHQPRRFRSSRRSLWP